MGGCGTRVLDVKPVADPYLRCRSSKKSNPTPTFHDSKLNTADGGKERLTVRMPYDCLLDHDQHFP